MKILNWNNSLLAQATTPAIDFDKLKATAFPPGSLPATPNLTLGAIISQAFNYLFVIAGLLLLFNLIMGGFHLMVGATDPKAKESASKAITNSFIGFIILFAAYWIIQILELVLGISVLG